MNDLKTFSDYHRVTWEKKLEQDHLFGEQVDLLGTKFLGPKVPRSAQDALETIEGTGDLDAYRYRGEPSDSERVDAARKAWDQLQEQKRADERKAKAEVEVTGHGETPAPPSKEEPPPAPKPDGGEAPK